MPETLFDFLMDTRGYSVKDGYLLRPDNSIAGELKNGRWIINAREYEIIEFAAFSGRCFPSMLCLDDLTNSTYRRLNKPMTRI
mgnify:CR=1 FL=1